MKKFVNVLWALTFGWFFALLNIIIGLLLCLTIIFIPIGLQYFKLANFVFVPLGRDFVPTKTSGFKEIINVIWAIFFGWEAALGYLFSGVFLCCTIIFIPFGLQYFKVAAFVLLPLGKTVEVVNI